MVTSMMMKMTLVTLTMVNGDVDHGEVDHGDVDHGDVNLGEVHLGNVDLGDLDHCVNLGDHGGINHGYERTDKALLGSRMDGAGLLQRSMQVRAGQVQKCVPITLISHILEASGSDFARLSWASLFFVGREAHPGVDALHSACRIFVLIFRLVVI